MDWLYEGLPRKHAASLRSRAYTLTRRQQVTDHLRRKLTGWPKKNQASIPRSLRRLGRSFARVVPTISGWHQGLGKVPAPSPLIHIRLSAAPDDERCDGPSRPFPSAEAAVSASSGKSPAWRAPARRSEEFCRRTDGRGSAASIDPQSL